MLKHFDAFSDFGSLQFVPEASGTIWRELDTLTLLRSGSRLLDILLEMSHGRLHANRISGRERNRSLSRRKYPYNHLWRRR